MSWVSVVEKMASVFFTMALPRIKNHKTTRDFMAKWNRDNYAMKTRLLFEAAVADAQNQINIPDSLVKELLDDQTNRNEVIRWALEGVKVDEFDEGRLNLEAYFENYKQYQDLLIPFFKLVLFFMEEYKETHWDPEFLQILKKLDLIDEIHDDVKQIKAGQSEMVQAVHKTNALIEGLLSPVGYEDLTELIREGKVHVARERASERLKKKHLKDEEALELECVIANSYIASGHEQSAVPHLQHAIRHCVDAARKSRLQALIHLLTFDSESALSSVREAVQLEGLTGKNAELLINVYIQQQDYDLALETIAENQDLDLDFLKSHIFLLTNQYQQALELSNSKLTETPNDILWNIRHVEALALQLEKDPQADVYRILDEALPHLTVVENSDVDNESLINRARALRAVLYFKAHRYSESKVLLQSLYQASPYGDAYFNNYLAACLCSSDWASATQLLSGRIREGKHSLHDVVTLAEVYESAGNSSTALELLKENRPNLQEQSISLEYYFAYVKSAFVSLDTNEISTLFEELEASYPSRKELHAIKAMYFMQLQDWDSAICNWEQCVDILNGTELTEAQIQMIVAYANRGNHDDLQKLLDLTVQVPHWEQHESLINRYIETLYRLGLYDQIIALYRNGRHENNLFLLDTATVIFFNFGWYEIAQQNYLVLYQTTHKFEYRLRYANCLFRLGKTDECHQQLEAAEKWVAQNGSPEDFSLLSSAFMSSLNYRKAMEYAFQTFVHAPNDSRMWKFYFVQSSQLSQFVENPERQWVDAYHQVLNEFATRFPDETPPFQAIQALKSEGGISDEFVDVLRKSTEFNLYLKKLMQDSQLPVSVMVKAFKKGPNETWTYAISEPDIRVWIWKGHSTDLNAQINDAEQASRVLCDFTTLYTIDYLGLLDALGNKYDKLYVYQDQFTEALHEYNMMKLIGETGLKQLSYENGQIVGREYSADYIKVSLDKQAKFLEWVDKNCSKLGRVIGTDEMEIEQTDPAKDVMDFVGTAKGHQCSLLIDSWMLINLAKEHGNVKGFTTFDFLITLRVNKDISSDKFYECVWKLIVTGHVLIPVTPDLVIHFLEKNIYKINDEVSAIFNYLHQNEFSDEFLVSLASDLLHWVWTAPIGTHDRTLLTDSICHVITFRRDKRKQIQQLLYATNKKFNVCI